MKNVFTIPILVISALIGADTLNAQWIRQNSGTNELLTDVIMLDTATAIAVGRDRSILRTSNAGTTWINVAAPLSFLESWNGVSFFDAAHGIVVGDHGGVVTTTNGGKNWTGHSIPTTQKCLSALCTGPGSMYVGADAGWVYNTSDTGKSWTAEKISMWPIRSLFTYRGPTILGVSKYALTSHSICTQYVIPPPSWGESILTNFQGLGSEGFDAEFCNGGDAGFIVGVQGDWRSAPTILRKSMSDTAWREVSSGIVRDGTLLGVSAPSANVIYVCGSNGMIYKSSNGGDTWLDQNVRTSRNVNAIFFYNEKRGFAVGDSGLILYTSNGGLTSVGDRGDFPPTKFVLEQNYPNPFNPETEIRYSVPSPTGRDLVSTSGRDGQVPGVSDVKLVVYDLLGREVSVLVNEQKTPGSYSVRFDAGGLASSVYFYRLQAGSHVETKKLLLLR